MSIVVPPTHTHATNLAGILTATADRSPDRAALRLDDTVVTYADLNEGSARVASLLAGLGVRPGDRVGIMLPNVVHFADCYYGVLRAGAVVVPMNVLLKGREVGFFLADSEAKVLLAWHQFAEAAEAGAASAEATCVLVGTPPFDDVLAGVEPNFDVVERDA